MAVIEECDYYLIHSKLAVAPRRVLIRLGYTFEELRVAILRFGTLERKPCQ